MSGVASITKAPADSMSAGTGNAEDGDADGDAVASAVGLGEDATTVASAEGSAVGAGDPGDAQLAITAAANTRHPMLRKVSIGVHLTDGHKGSCIGGGSLRLDVVVRSPDVDRVQAVAAHREGDLAVVVGVVGEEPLQDRRSRVELALVAVETLELVAPASPGSIDRAPDR